MKKTLTLGLFSLFLLAPGALAQGGGSGRSKDLSFQFGSTGGGRQVSGTGSAFGVAYNLPRGDGYKSLELFHTRVAGSETVYYSSGSATLRTLLETTGLFYTARTRRPQERGFYTGIGGGLVYEKTALPPDSSDYFSLPRLSQRWRYQLQLRWIAAGYNFADDIFGELSYQGNRHIVAFNVGYRL
ncbi:hypothetical protein [Armatimonas rosea]|uniref:Outer membrane protein beta-barrel domain-containing protein n=1 Tax=Armatimonas rosea TaxID=685828 RepID=A0A7W9SNF8_ARMRO|nr:hypothetical protein [Armatimonas rosea]MBB6049389.1 hypothetical protein [Armatimonas rosea]